jgi:hypothetical protein
MTTWTEQSKTGRIARYDGMLLNSSDFLLLNGITLHLKMNDDAASTTVVDSSGNGNDGIFSVNTDTVSSVGKINQALLFNNSDFINVPYDSIFDFTQFHFSKWIYLTDYDTDDSVGLLVKLNHFIFRIAKSSQTLQLILWNGSSYSEINSAVTVPMDTWTKIDCSFDGTTVKMYINNAEIVSTSGTLVVGTSSDLRIGSQDDTRAFGGYIDDVRIYGRVLSEEERTQIYNDGVGIEDTNINTDKLLLTNSTDSEITTTWTNETK